MSAATDPRALAVRALEQMRGDDLARARRQFAGKSAEWMAAPHNDRETRAQVLAELEARDAAITAAVAWVKAAR